MRCVVAEGFLVVVALAASADALACQCLANVPTVVPPDGSVDVVRDANIWVATSRRLEIEDISIVDDRGLRVEGNWSTIVHNILGFQEVAVFHPERLLRSNATYEVGANTVGHLATFTTSAEVAVGVPTISSRQIDFVLVDVGGSSSECKRNADHFVQVGVSAEHTGEFLLVDVDRVSQLDVTSLHGSVVNIVAGDTVGFGSSSCAGRWPNAAPGVSGRVRLGSLDVAGNFSGWSDEFVVEVPLLPDDNEDAGEPPQGCASAPASAPFAVALLFALRRRRLRDRRAATSR